MRNTTQRSVPNYKTTTGKLVVRVGTEKHETEKQIKPLVFVKISKVRKRVKSFRLATIISIYGMLELFMVQK